LIGIDKTGIRFLIRRTDYGISAIDCNNDDRDILKISDDPIPNAGTVQIIPGLEGNEGNILPTFANRMIYSKVKN